MANRSSNQLVVPEAKQGLKNLKMEVANQVGLSNYDTVDKGNLTARQNGYVGGNMTKKMVEAYENSLK